MYNLGGGRDNSISILEAFDLIASISGKEMRYRYDETNRIGDHMCYISNLEKMKAHFPEWSITKDLPHHVSGNSCILAKNVAALLKISYS